MHRLPLPDSLVGLLASGGAGGNAELAGLVLPSGTVCPSLLSSGTDSSLAHSGFTSPSFSGFLDLKNVKLNCLYLSTIYLEFPRFKFSREMTRLREVIT